MHLSYSIALMLISTLETAIAYSRYTAGIPNAEIFEKKYGRPVGHKASTTNEGNAFGNAFAKVKSWKEICDDDADGDGYTNGAELGDPNCVWTPNSTPSGGLLSDPSDVNSTPKKGSANVAVKSKTVRPEKKGSSDETPKEDKLTLSENQKTLTAPSSVKGTSATFADSLSDDDSASILLEDLPPKKKKSTTEPEPLLREEEGEPKVRGSKPEAEEEGKESTSGAKSGSEGESEKDKKEEESEGGSGSGSSASVSISQNLWVGHVLCGAIAILMAV